MIEKLDHASLATPDLERSVAFYKDILGMKVEFQMGEAKGLGRGIDARRRGHFAIKGIYYAKIRFELSMDVCLARGA